MPNTAVTFDDFLGLPVYFYNTIGIEPYESKNNTVAWRRLLLFKFLFLIANLNFVLVLEIAFIVLAFNNSELFVEACMVMAYIGFVCVGELKMITVWWQKPKLTHLVKEMESIFPGSRVEVQQQYQIETYAKRCHFFTRGFAFLYLFLVITYNLYVLIPFLVHRFILHSPDVQMVMPYTPVSPWDLEKGWGFCLMYSLQAMAGYTCTAGNMSSDILIYSVVIQDIMHFDYLSKSFEEFNVRGEEVRNGRNEDLMLLQKLVAYHIRLLG